MQAKPLVDGDARMVVAKEDGFLQIFRGWLGKDAVPRDGHKVTWSPWDEKSIYFQKEAAIEQ